MDGLRSSPSGRLKADDLQTELERYFSDDEAEQQLDTIIDWGRYAELFAFDEDSGELFLEADA
jgi:NitT/TauT family transport system ATP-binding protein